MITSLSISSFQSHKKTVLALSPGVNVLIGASDSGKSSILRALKWLVTNRPLGDGFNSWGGGKAEVAVTLDENTTIGHTQGKYILSTNSNDKDQKWEAIGTGVPETIEQTLNISPLSFQWQMDAPFLLSESPGEVARMLNEVADLDKIDSTLVNINRMMRDNRSALVEGTANVRQLTLDMSAYRNVDRQIALVAGLKEKERKAGTLEVMAGDGEAMANRVRSCRHRLSEAKDTTAAEDQLKYLLEFQIELGVVEKQFIHCGQLVGEYQSTLLLVQTIRDTTDAEKMIARLEEQKRRAEGLEVMVRNGELILGELERTNSKLSRTKDTERLGFNIEDLIKLDSDNKKNWDKMETLAGILHSIDGIQVRMEDDDRYLERYEQQWKKDFPAMCPLCGQRAGIR